ncbi:MAG: DEAD/DEAH box helicase [Treponema sp.]|nr:DEAD/DEAH box helicase [Treponema sp.]
MEFKDFDLHPDLQRGIAEANYVTCMDVQEQVLTHAFGGQDLYVQSQTGTGKTAAFLIVIFQRLLSEDFLSGKKALIMAPTRELAVQIEEEAKVLAKYLPFKTGSFYGGVGYAQQERLLRENAQILVGTPGRVLDLNASGRMNLMDIAFLVLDEADRMFDMGFYPDLRKLIRVVPPADRRQTMLFSATLNAYVKNLAWEYTRNPFEIEIQPEIVTVEEIDQVLYHVPSNDKMRMLLGVLQREKPESAIIFCNTKRYTEIVAKRLRMNGYECEFIIGDLPQVKRLKVIDDLKAGKVRFLVATDVAARGLDIEALAMVVNYDLPTEAENYVHRIGRTARAGKTGRAVTLASDQDVYELPAIERYIGKKIPSEIASAELYGTDDSAGRRVNSDFYESRHDDRSSGRGNGRPPRRGDSSARGERPPRRDAPIRDGGGRRDERRGEEGRGRRPERSSAGGERPARTGERSGPRPEAQGQDLSGLSFDERMAVYKKKYSGEKPGNEGGRQGKRTEQGGSREGSDRPRGEQRRADGPRRSDKPRGADKPRRADGPRGADSPRRADGQRRADKPRGAAGDQGAPRRNQKPGGQRSAEPAKQQREEQAKTKPNILSKLLGIFKKG